MYNQTDSHLKKNRIISLLPSSTEIICALGLKEQLIGRSHECDYPAEVQKLPVCSEPKYRSDGTSAEINKEVESILRDALSIYKVDAEKIKTLKPTHIITQSQCEVCAVSTDELQEALNEYLQQDEVTVIDLTPESIEQVLENILQIANALDAQVKGEALVNNMKRSFDDISTKTKELHDKPSIAHIEWIEPSMVAGHWMMTLIEMAGGVNCFPDENKRWIKFEELLEQNPDKIIIAPCGFTIERTLKDMFYFENRTEWKTLKAVRNNEVYICDGNKYFNRPGPRLVDSLEILAEIFHPHRFASKHRKSGWIKYMMN
ncbi:MAG: cobalamin-binding protein [Bacteroidetes bacterium]|nr:cobalamin-binding protein [Bacteroidota bacterium]